MTALYNRQRVGIVALLIWVASVALPVETDCGEVHAVHGYDILVVGWLFGFNWQFGWFANPFMLWMIARLLCDRRPGIIAAIIGFGLALTALAWKTTPRGDAPGVSTICEWHAGFYLWLSCAALLALVAVLEFATHIRSKPAEGA